LCQSSSRPAGAWERLSSDKSGIHTSRGSRHWQRTLR
jgi:hypothetical protein